MNKGRMVWLFVAVVISGVGAAFSQTPPPEIELKAKVRDFKDEKTTVPSSHPHFFGSNATPTACDGQKLVLPSVADDIDITDAEDTAVFRGDKRGPKLLPTLDAK